MTGGRSQTRSHGHRSAYVATTSPDGVWASIDGVEWMYQSLPADPVFWQQPSDRDRLAENIDAVAASFSGCLLDGPDSREVHFVAIARDDPVDVAVPRGSCPEDGSVAPLVPAVRAGTAPIPGWPRASVFALGVQLGRYAPPPRPDTLLGRFHAAAAAHRDAAHPRRRRQRLDKRMRRLDTLLYVLRHPYADPGTAAASAAMRQAGAAPLDTEQSDRLLGWQARSDNLESVFVAAGDGTRVESDAWSRDIPSGCSHPLVGGLLFCALVKNNDAAQHLHNDDLVDAFAQRSGLVAVSVRAWLIRHGDRAVWDRVCAVAAFRIAEGCSPDLETAPMQAQHITPGVLVHRQMAAFKEVCPLSTHRILRAVWPR